MIWATPALPLPAWVSVGHSTVEPLLRVHTPLPLAPAALSRNFVKLSVVPDESERCATTMSVAGNVTPGLSVAIAASFHFLIWRWKILAIVSGLSCSLSTSRLYDSVIGATTIGKYKTSPPLNLPTSAAGIGESDAAKSVT